MKGEYCSMRGMLSFLILFLLSKRPMHGEAIAEDLKKRKGIKPSPGTIYPALRTLKNARLIKEIKSNKTITYGLTPKGKTVLVDARNRFCRIFTGVFTP